ncbi:Adenosine/AMP deaminase-like protein 1 [Elsinoe fawcettii]|nr:Adenosine/AMP deaminase-like protein 1 [Elsinoe fawcettii]
MSTLSEADRAFCKALPKVELHAHFTGSISRQTLHEIWLRKRAAGELEGVNAIEDPLVAIPPAANGVNITTFFPIFSTNLYHLLTHPLDLTTALTSVLTSFAADGVVHLELRTTPRATAGLSKSAYVQLLLQHITQWNAAHENGMQTFLILSVDRRNTRSEAAETVDLALQFKGQGVVGLDLCGDPTLGVVRVFRDEFARAKKGGLKLTVHFGEVSGDWVEGELMELLSWGPERLGHVICLEEGVKEEVRRRGCGLELCLSCNVLAGMSEGGFGEHHFGGWRGGEGNAVALSTDDVGIFESELSNEYALVMEHFGLSRKEIVELSRQAAGMVFAGEEVKKRIMGKLEEFEKASC